MQQKQWADFPVESNKPSPIRSNQAGCRCAGTLPGYGPFLQLRPSDILAGNYRHVSPDSSGRLPSGGRGGECSVGGDGDGGGKPALGDEGRKAP